MFSSLNSFYILVTFSALLGLQSWELITSDEGRFSVLSPAPLEHKADTFHTALGPIMQHNYFFADYDGLTENNVYMISYHDFPDNTFPDDSTRLREFFLESSIDEAVKALKGQKIYDEQVKFQGETGRLYKIMYNDSSAIVKSKIFIVEDRFYNVRVFSTTSTDPNSDMNRFLDSFRWFESY